MDQEYARKGSSKKKGSKKKSPKKKSSRRNSSDEKGYEGNPQKPTGKVIGTIRRLETRSNTDSIFDCELDLDSDLKKCLKSVWEDPPSTLKLCELDPKAIDALSRPNKRKMLQMLSKKRAEEKLCVAINSEDQNTVLEFLPKKVEEGGQGLSFAAILALSMALRSSANLFAELVGCATPETVQELFDYLQPPLITLKELPVLIHCAARHITHDRKNRSPQPVRLALRTTDAIAAVLRQSEELQKPEGLRRFTKLKRNKKLQKYKEKSQKMFEELIIATLLSAETDKDLGCQAGLLLAGVQSYILREKDESNRKRELCELFVDVSSGLLTGIPIAGFAFSPVGSLAKYLLKFQGGKEEIYRDKLSQAVKEFFDEIIGGPIFLDEQCVMEVAKGTHKEATHKKSDEWKIGQCTRKVQGEAHETITFEKDVKWGTFNKWYEQVVKWNAKEIRYA